MSLFESSDVLSVLSPADLAIAELKALLAEPLSKGAFLDVVRGAGVVLPNGNLYSGPKVNESVARLVQKRVLSGDGVIAPSWREPLTLQVIRRPGAAALLAAVRAAAPRSWREQGGYEYWRAVSPYADIDLARSVRLMALANDGAEVERLIGIAEQTVAGDVRDLAIGPLGVWRTSASLTP